MLRKKIFYFSGKIARETITDAFSKKTFHDLYNTVKKIHWNNSTFLCGYDYLSIQRGSNT